jgi:hypothetical protein
MLQALLVIGIVKRRNIVCWSDESHQVALDVRHQTNARIHVVWRHPWQCYCGAYL